MTDAVDGDVGIRVDNGGRILFGIGAGNSSEQVLTTGIGVTGTVKSTGAGLFGIDSGVGTTSPQAALTVRSDIIADGIIDVGSNGPQNGVCLLNLTTC